MADRKFLKGYWWNSSIFLLFMLLNLNIAAQNLVPNPSFEEYDSLICVGRIGRAIAADGGDISEYTLHWSNPTDISSDLYSLILNDTCNLSPNRISLAPFAGNNYSELITYLNINPSFPLFSDFRSYLQAALTEKVYIGSLIKASMMVSTIDSISFFDAWSKENRWSIQSFTNNLGMYFSKDSLNFKTSPDTDRPYTMPIPVEP